MLVTVSPSAGRSGISSPGTFLVCRPIFLPADGATHTRWTSIMLVDRAVPVEAGRCAGSYQVCLGR